MTGLIPRSVLRIEVGGSEYGFCFVLRVFLPVFDIVFGVRRLRGIFCFGGEREDVSVSKKYFIRLEGFRNIRFSVDARYAPQRFFD